jgi:hypothetical protein
VAGIEASRDDTEKASVITFRSISRIDSSNSRSGESRLDNGVATGIKEMSDSNSNPSRASNSRDDSSQKSALSAGSGITGNTGDNFGRFSTEEKPLSFEARPGESVTLDDLKTRRETKREEFVL